MAEQTAQVSGGFRGVVSPGQPAQAAQTEELTSDELLVEEVSIDGMCGVY